MVTTRCVALGLLCALTMNLNAAELPQLGSGAPGLKVATRKPDAFVIYQDEPSTVGIGLQGGMLQRRIQVLFDMNYDFSKEHMEIPEQLYSFDPNSVFTCTGGRWNSDFTKWEYAVRKSIGYRLVGSQVQTFDDVQGEARKKYGLRSTDVFLGVVEGRVYFWSNFIPSRIYWRQLNDKAVYSAKMPDETIDIYGVTKGIRKDIGFVVFAKSTGWFKYSPYTTKFVEMSLSQGVLTNAP